MRLPFPAGLCTSGRSHPLVKSAHIPSCSDSVTMPEQPSFELLQNACASSKDSDQPGHALSGCLRAQAFFLPTARTDRNELMPRLI